MYTKTQNQIINHTRQKVGILFAKFPVRAHGIDHVKRVRNWAVKIAKAEKANAFLCELSAWLHDIGRVKETLKVDGSNHCEFSYEICREWFMKDEAYRSLTSEEKKVILYSVRYHWNNAADKYSEAIILRDADKLDLLGNVGVQRIKSFWGKDMLSIERILRFVFCDIYWLRTKTAQSIVARQDLDNPTRKYYFSLLKKRIKPVKL